MILMQRLKVQGFVVTDYAARYPEAIQALAGWMAAAKLKVRQDVEDGLDNALEVLKKLFTGANTCKLMIRVADV